MTGNKLFRFVSVVAGWRTNYVGYFQSIGKRHICISIDQSRWETFWVKRRQYIRREIENANTFNAICFRLKFLPSKWLRSIIVAIRFALHCLFFFHRHSEILYTRTFSITEFKFVEDNGVILKRNICRSSTTNFLLFEVIM